MQEIPKQSILNMFVFQKNKSTVSPSWLPFSWANCYFLTVLQSVAQSVFNASQGIRDLGLLSWTPLTVFPPQVSCVREKENSTIAYASLVILNPFQSSLMITITVKTNIWPWTTVAWFSVILIIYWHFVVSVDCLNTWVITIWNLAF